MSKGPADATSCGNTSRVRPRLPFRWSLAAIAVGAFIARVAYILAVANRISLGLDSVWYVLESGVIGAHKGYLVPGTFMSTGRSVATAGQPPLYPTFLA